MSSKEQSAAMDLSIEAGNVLIAEFMCGQRFEFTDDFDRECSGIRVNDSVYPLDKLEYHSSWDWLMPVVEKISKIEAYREFDDDEHTIEIIRTHYPRTFGMLNDETHQPMFRYNCAPLFQADTLIEAAWLATVDFVKEYKTLIGA